MDKYEYKIRADEIKSLISEGKYADAVKIADTIDWKRVKSVTMLCTISDLYKINRRFEESKEILLMAYERYPDGRAIVYSLCELSIKMGEFVQAVEYYKEFVRIAPRDTGRYILQYKLYEAQDVSLEERIAVLEELKKHDYREKWAYQLAYLYHRVGLATECVEECDEMYLWFGDGKFVMKALELKMLHEPLSEDQQESYRKFKAGTAGKVDEKAPEEEEKDNIGVDEADETKQPTREMYDTPEEAAEVMTETAEAPEAPREEKADQQDEPQEQPAAREPFVRTPDYANKFDTINLQKAIAESMKEIMGDLHTAPRERTVQGEPTRSFRPEEPEDLEDQMTESMEAADVPEAQTEDFGQQEELFEQQTESMSTPMMQELFYEDTQVPEEDKKVPEEQIPVQAAPASEPEPYQEERYDGQLAFAGAVPSPVEEEPVYEPQPEQDEHPGAVVRPLRAPQTSHFDNMLAQDYDGQISLVVPEEQMVEKQITGQISIGDIMSRIKREQQERQMQDVRRRVADETSNMFAEFDEKAKADLQVRIEKAVAEALRREREKKTFGEEKPVSYNGNVIMPDQSAQPYVLAGKADAIPDEDIQNLDLETEADSMESDAAQEGITEGEAAGNAAVNTEPGKAENSGAEEKAEPEETLSETAEEAAQEEAPSETAEEAVQEETSSETAEEAVQEEAPSETAEEAVQEETPSETAEEAVQEEMPSEAAEEAEKEEKKPEVQDTETKDAADDGEKAQASGASEEESSGDADEPEGEVSAGSDAADELSESDTKSMDPESRELETRVRVMTPEEKDLFGPYIHHRKSRRQIIRAIDSLSMNAGTNNAIVTGAEGAGTVSLAKGLIRSVQTSGADFSGKVAKITAEALNHKSVGAIIDKLPGGALIIQKAGSLKADTLASLQQALKSGNKKMIVIMEDTRTDMDRMLRRFPELKETFNVRVDIEALDDDALVAYAKQYALEKEYAIDNLGILALHTRIEDMQTLDHEVTISEVKDIVDDAIYYAEKGSVGHFFDVLFNKRYDEEDMIILREKDFMH
ncbi:MAG: hypothetical protein LKF52_09405 [Butyrivibrio sp.]|nr:hypothetical protein [Butyrivibrio sp.]